MASGIYIIFSKCKPERQYVGSAVDFTSRWLVHQSNLFHNCHHNAIMQNHSNKYGYKDFVFVILEPCARERLIELEQKWIDALNPYFNINPVAGSRLGSKHSAFTRLKMSHSWKRRKPISQLSRLLGRFQKDS